MTTFIQHFLAARRVSTPLIAVQTPDPAATIQGIIAALNGKAPAILHWDFARGMAGVNDAGKAAFKSLGVDPMATINPVEALTLAAKLPEDAILFMANAQNFLGKGDGSPTQAVWNLRDAYKATGRTLILLTPGMRLPPEVEQDIMILVEPLPTPEDLEQIVMEQFAAAGLPLPAKSETVRAVDALCGLAAFSAEQVTAMSLTKNGLNFEGLWERKRQVIEQTPGLSVWRGGETFADIGGCDNVKGFISKLLKGNEPPRVIVFIDEIEKAVAGSGGDGGAGDTSGVSQEMNGTLLTEMQNSDASGLLFLGPPGAAKSAMAKAAGAEGGIPTIAFDFSAMKASLVGQSGERLRAALRVVEAVGQGRALYVATCNSIGALSPELRRRFTEGTFFFDLPSADERDAIWAIYLAKYKVSGERPNDTGWTGAEIKTCCRNAWKLKLSLVEASAYLVPVAKSAGARIEKLRQQASGNFVSASYPGLYNFEQIAAAPEPRGRKISAGVK